MRLRGMMKVQSNQSPENTKTLPETHEECSEASERAEHHSNTSSLL